MKIPPQSALDPLQKQLLDDSEIASLREQASQILSTSDNSQKQTSREAGWLPTSALGSGMDYAESREYQQGDDPRYINWRLSARSNETFVKTYHMEARPSLAIVLDQRRPMIFGTKVRLKSTQALRIATMLAFVAETLMLELKILLIRDDIKIIQTQAVDTFLAEANFPPSIYSSNKQSQECELEQVFETLHQELNVGSLVYLISDFMDLGLNPTALQQLQEDYFIQALLISDPAEKQLPKSGGVSLQAVNNNNKISIDCNNPDVIENSHSIFSEHFAERKNTLLRAVSAYAEIQTDEDTLYPKIVLPIGH